MQAAQAVIIQFVELDFQKSIFQKSSTDQQGVSSHCCSRISINEWVKGDALKIERKIALLFDERIKVLRAKYFGDKFMSNNDENSFEYFFF